MSVGEYIVLICPCFLPLMVFEILNGRLVKNRMPEILLSAENRPDSRYRPDIWVFKLLAIVLLRVILLLIGGGNQHLFFREDFSNRAGAFALVRKLEDVPDYLCGLRVNDKRLLIVFDPVVAIGDAAGTAFPIFHSGVKDGSDFIAGVLGIPLVHDIKERGKIIAGSILTVDSVVDGDEPHILLREHHFGVESNLQIVSSEPAHVLNDDGADLPGLHLGDQRLKAGPIEIHTGISIVREVDDVSQTVSAGIVFKVLLLIGNRVRLTYKVIISRQSLIECCHFCFSCCSLHGLPPPFFM